MFRTLSALTLLLACTVAQAVVFIYHRFGDDRYTSTNIRMGQFEQQLTQPLPGWPARHTAGACVHLSLRGP